MKDDLTFDKNKDAIAFLGGVAIGLLAPHNNHKMEKRIKDLIADLMERA
jgi:hypothetical protein